MKKLKIAVLVLVAIMAVGVFASCSAAPTTKVKISFVDEVNNKSVIDLVEVELTKENPTVMDAVIAVKDMFVTMEGYAEIDFSSNGKSVKNVDDCKEKLDGEELEFWKFFINEKEPAGEAGDVAVKDGDMISYTFIKEAKKADN